MASILDRYGIKEVADVTFYKINENTAKPDYPILYLDTLKVSTIEQTAENVEAKGGKGNASLISWDYGKEINVTIEDALFSAKSMAIMFGNGQVKNIKKATGEGVANKTVIMKTETFKATDSTVPTKTGNAWTDTSGWKAKFEGPDGKPYDKLNPRFFDGAGTEISDSQTLTLEEKYFCTFDLEIEGTVIEISANSFPGTYYVTGDTWARSETSGDDEFFQFIIPKAKVTSENTITLEAEGDPSVFNMNLRVLRPADGVMMKLVKYNLPALDDETQSVGEAELYHNHALVSGEESDVKDGSSAARAIEKSLTTSLNATSFNDSSEDGYNDKVVFASVKGDSVTVAMDTTNHYVVKVTPVAAGTSIITCVDNQLNKVRYYKVTVTTA